MDQKSKKVKNNESDNRAITDGDIKKSLLNKVRDPRDRGDSKAETGNVCISNSENVSFSPEHSHNEDNGEKEKTDENIFKITVKKEARIIPDGSRTDDLDETVQNSKVKNEDSLKLKVEELKTKTKHAKMLANKKNEQQSELLKTTKDVTRKVDDGKSKIHLTSPAKDSENNDVQHRTYLDYEGRKRLRERYTVRLKSNQNLNKNIDSKGSAKFNVKNGDRYSKKQTDDETDNPMANESSKDISQIDSARLIKKQKESQAQRKPLIKTIRLSDDNRVYNDYKSVTFMDQKEYTPLRIKVPLKYPSDRKETTYKSAETNTVRYKLRPEMGKVSEHINKPIKKKKEKSHTIKKRAISPVTVISYGSPNTEVAKWAPSSINRHTIPYYEAWVDTTLAAITKSSENNDTFLSRQNIIQTFKRALDMEGRPRSPELVYEKYNDENYTGRIKVRQAQHKKTIKHSCKQSVKQM